MNLEIIKDSIQKKLLGKSEKMVGSPEPDSSMRSNFLKPLNEFAKSMVSLPGLAKDLNIAKRNLGALIKLKGGKPANKADMFFLKADEREAKFEVDMANQISKDEASKTPTTEKKEEEPQDPLQKIMTSLLGVFGLGALGKYFSISKILKSLKIIGITFLITTIASGIYQAYKEFTKTGDILASVKAGFVEFIDFVTMGIFGKKNIGKLFDDVINFLVPIAETVGNFIDGIGKFFSKKFEQFKRFFGLKEEKQSEPKTEEARKSYIETLNEDINFLKEKRDSLNSIVEKKSEKLKTLQEEERRKRIEEAKASAQKVKDVVKNVGSKILNVISPPTKTEAPAPAPSAAPAAASTPAPAPSAPSAPLAAPDKKPTSGGLKSLVKLEKSHVDLSISSTLEERLLKLAQSFKEVMNENIQINSGRRTGEYQKKLFLDLDSKKNKGYNPLVKSSGGFEQLTGQKQEQILKDVRGGIALPSAKTLPEGITIDKYGNQPGVVIGKKHIPGGDPPSNHELGTAVDIATADLENPKFQAKVGNIDNYLPKIGLWRALHKDVNPKTSKHETWHVELFGNIGAPDSTGKQIESASKEVSAGQREQEKRQTPTVINAGTTNNNTHVVNKHRVETQPA
jgi:hypothetical protein